MTAKNRWLGLLPITATMAATVVRREVAWLFYSDVSSLLTAHNHTSEQLGCVGRRLLHSIAQTCGELKDWVMLEPDYNPDAVDARENLVVAAAALVATRGAEAAFGTALRNAFQALCQYAYSIDMVLYDVVANVHRKRRAP